MACCMAFKSDLEIVFAIQRWLRGFIPWYWLEALDRLETERSALMAQL
jgi:hypothetical protein